MIPKWTKGNEYMSYVSVLIEHTYLEQILQFLCDKRVKNSVRG
jgi:hypothetical protein